MEFGVNFVAFYLYFMDDWERIYWSLKYQDNILKRGNNYNNIIFRYSDQDLVTELVVINIIMKLNNKEISSYYHKRLIFKYWEISLLKFLQEFRD